MAEVTHTLSLMANIACGLLTLIFVMYQALVQTFKDWDTFGYLMVAIAGIIVLRTGWIVQQRRNALSTVWSTVVSAGTTVALLGLCFARESVRANAIDMTPLYQRHADAAQVGGFAVFLIFTVLVSAAMAWCFVTVHRGLNVTDRQGERPA